MKEWLEKDEEDWNWKVIKQNKRLLQ
jgi:hypothetical protein